MTMFRYAALNAQGERIKGEVDASDERAATQLIRENGELLISIEPINRRQWFKLERKTQLSYGDAASFSVELSGLLNAGAPLRQALTIMMNGTGVTARLSATCMRNIEQGQPLSAGLSGYSGSGRILSAFVKAGEAGAGLGTLLESAGHFMAARAEALSRIRKALAYPVFILVLAIVALLVITVYVAPSLEPILEQSDQSSLILNLAVLGHFIQANQQWILLSVAALIIGCFTLLRGEHFKGAVNAFVWRLPWIGATARDLDTGQSCDVLAALLEKGQALDVSLSTAASVSGPKLSNVYLSIANDLRNGVVASEAFANATDLPKDLRRLIILGEKSSAFARAIRQAGQICHARALRKIDQIASILGPTLVIGLGVLVSILMLSVLNSLGSLGEVT